MGTDSHTEFLAAPSTVANFGDWLVEIDITDPNGDSLTLRFSRRGTVIGSENVDTPENDTLPADTLYYKRLLVAPTIQQALWRSGQIGGSSLPAFGGLVLNNRDGGLDQYKPSEGYIWAGSPCRVYFCDTRTENIASSVAKVFDGKIGHPKFSLDALEIPLLGRESDFQQPSSSRVYRGTSYQLELTGDRTVSYGTPSAVNITGSMAAEAWLWLETAPTGNVLFWGWNGASPWRLVFNSARTISLFVTIGGVSESKTTSFVFTAQKPYHFAFVISGRDVTFYIWDDDAQTLTVESTTNAFSNATRQAAAGPAYVFRSGSDATFKIWGDEMRVWNTTRTQAQFAANRFGEIPTGSIPAALVHYPRMNDGTGTTVTDSSATAANGTIAGAGTSTWLWAMEGDSTLAGTPKPDLWGQGYNLACVLVDPIRQVYQIAGGGAMNAITTTFEGGNAHTMDASAASLRALMTTSPTAGHSLPYPTRGLFRLGSAPTKPISAQAQGYSATPGYSATAAGIIRSIIQQRGPKLANGNLDTGSFTALDADDNSVCGVHLLQPEPITQLLDYVSGSVGAWWGYERASTLFHVERFEGPAVTADHDFTARHIVSLEEASPQTVIYEVRVKFRHNEVVMTEEQVSASVVGTVGWQVLTQEWQEEVATDQDLRAQYPGDASRSITVETALQDRIDARDFAAFLLALLGGIKQTPVVTIAQPGFQVAAGDTVTIQFVTQGGVERLGYDGTHELAVLAINDRQQEGQVTMELFG